MRYRARFHGRVAGDPGRSHTVATFVNGTDTDDARLNLYKRFQQIRGLKLWEAPPEERHPVLCGCGWGSLAMPVSEIPTHCPMCGNEVEA